METSGLDFEGLGRELIGRAREILPEWLPGGRVVGREFVCGNLAGEPGSSLKVNLSTGKWADFASDEKGGDLVSLYAAIGGLGQSEAYRQLTDRLGPGKALPTSRRGRQPPRAPREKPSDLIPPPDDAHVPAMRHATHGPPTAHWQYLDAAGKTLFYIARYDVAGERKQFIPWSWSRELKTWVPKAWPAPRPLYGLDRLAKRPGAPVLIVEGEKAADAARALAGHVYCVVTWPNGSKAWDKADWRLVSERKVLIWPDADEPGLAAARGIAAALYSNAPEVKILDVTGQPDGWDAADAAADGWDWTRFKEWAKPRAQVYIPPPMPAVEPAPPPPIEPEIVEGPPPHSDADRPAVQVNVRLGAIEGDDQGLVPASMYALWEKLGIAVSQQGQPICNVDNALRVLEGHEPYKNVVWFDEFHGKYFTSWGGGEVREWRDIDELKLTVQLQRDLGLRRISDDMIHRAVMVYADRHVKNEPRDWMEGLLWDGTPRVDTFFIDCLGAADNDYTRAASRNFWVAMAARVYQPGCQFRNVVVLEGPQEIGKSTALAIIGGRWYTEAQESVSSKDFFVALQGKLVVEIGEMDSFSRAEVTRIKQVISCRTDRFRAPYARAAQDMPRRCVFVGTTNEDTYLRDHTGGTRFWPIKCGRIDFDRIRDARGQFFAEAVHLFKAGTTWWEVPKEQAQAEQEHRRQGDEWEQIVAEFLVGKDEVTVKDVAVDALSVDVAKLDLLIQKRVGSVLRVLGWEKHNLRRYGSQMKVWRRRGLELAPDPDVEVVPF